MPSDYANTKVPFERYVLSDLHDPIILGPGHASMEGAAELYTAMAEMFDKASGDLRAVMKKSQAFHEGAAADASHRHINLVATAGEVGAEQARLASYALQEQAAYYGRARLDMQAAAEEAARAAAAGVAPGPGVPTSGSKGPSQIALDEYEPPGRPLALHASHMYEDNSNHNQSYIFQAFDVPTVPTPDISVVAAAADQGSAGGGLRGGAYGVSPAGGAGAAVSAGQAVGQVGAAQAGAAQIGAAFPVGVGPVGGGQMRTDRGSGGPMSSDESGGGAAGRPRQGGAPSASAAPTASGAVPGGAGGSGQRGGPAVGDSPGGVTSGGARPGVPGPGGIVQGADALPRTSGAAWPPASQPSPGWRDVVRSPQGSGPGQADAGGSGWTPGQPWSSRSGNGVADLPGAGGTPAGRFPGGDSAANRLPGRGWGSAERGTGAGGGGSNAGSERAYGARPTTPAPGEGAPHTAASSRAASGTGQSPASMMPMSGAGGRGQDSTHPRPRWLVEEDPEAFWMSGLPPHGPAIIEPFEE